MSTQAAAFGTPHRHPSADRLSLAYRVYGERNILSPATVAHMQFGETRRDREDDSQSRPRPLLDEPQSMAAIDHLLVSIP